MIFGSAKLYLVTLIRYKTNSILQIQIDANNELEAQLYAIRIIGEGWISECAELISCPNWAYEEYRDYKFWEEMEDSSENCRKFFHILGPYELKSYLVPGITNRKDLFVFLDKLISNRENYVRSDRV